MFGSIRRSIGFCLFIAGAALGGPSAGAQSFQDTIDQAVAFLSNTLDMPPPTDLNGDPIPIEPGDGDPGTGLTEDSDHLGLTDVVSSGQITIKIYEGNVRTNFPDFNYVIVAMVIAHEYAHVAHVKQAPFLSGICGEAEALCAEAVTVYAAVQWALIEAPAWVEMLCEYYSSLVELYNRPAHLTDVASHGCPVGYEPLPAHEDC